MNDYVFFSCIVEFESVQISRLVLIVCSLYSFMQSYMNQNTLCELFVEFTTSPVVTVMGASFSLKLINAV